MTDGERNGALMHSCALQSALVLLLRLLAWKRVQRVVAGDEALQFLLVAGRPASGKAHLMSLLAGGALGAGRWA